MIGAYLPTLLVFPVVSGCREVTFATVFLPSVKAGFISFWPSFSQETTILKPKTLKLREIDNFQGKSKKGKGNPAYIHVVGKYDGCCGL